MPMTPPSAPITRRRPSTWTAAVLLHAALAVEANAQLNTQCPVMTSEEADPEITVTYRGKQIAFCCDTCVEKFQANPERYLSRLPQFAAADEADGGAPASERDHSAVPWIGRLHPAVVHFPIAGLPLALLAYLLWLANGRESFARADVVPLIIGTLGSVAAFITGDTAHENMRFSGRLHDLVEQHEWCSTAVMVLALLLTGLRLWRWNRLSGRWRWLYAGGLTVTAILLAITGYLGGSLVFGPDHLKW